MKIKFILLCVFLLSGCGTVLSLGHIGYQEVSINSNVDEPDIKINGATIKTNRGKFELNKSDDGAFIQVSKDGYKTSQVYLQRELRPGIMILDAFLLAPLIIDIINNEIYEFKPSNLTVFLTKENRK